MCKRTDISIARAPLRSGKGMRLMLAVTELIFSFFAVALVYMHPPSHHPPDCLHPRHVPSCPPGQSRTAVMARSLQTIDDYASPQLYPS